MIRVLSSRVPYQRGGLSFTSSTVRAPDGRRVIELSAMAWRSLSPEQQFELGSDPAIEVQHGVPETAATEKAAPVAQPTPATALSGRSKPLSGASKAKPRPPRRRAGV